VLRPPAGERRTITLHRCDDEIAGSESGGAPTADCWRRPTPKLSCGATWRSSNSHQRPEPGDGGIRCALGHPTSLWGGCASYDRREIKDCWPTLRLAGETRPTASACCGCLNVPRARHRQNHRARRLTDRPPPSWVLPSGRWSAIRRSVRSLAGRSAKGLLQSAN